MKTKTNYKRVLADQKKRLEKIKEALMQLHFLTQNEILGILEKLEFMPPKAFQEVLHVLKEGKVKQDDFMKKAIKRDPEFVKKLDKALKKKYQDIVKEISEEEEFDADHILDQIIKHGKI